jgi:type II secretory pathway component PulF
MQTYAYEAYDDAGRIHKDTIRARNRREARSLLRARDNPLYAAALTESRASTSRSAARFRREKALLYHEIALYHTAGADRHEMADDVIRVFEESKPQWRRVAVGFLDALRSNKPYYRAAAEFPRIFGAEEVNLLQHAHEKGREVQTLELLASSLRREDDLSGKVRNVLWYPGVLSIAAVIVLGIYGNSLLPQLRTLYDELQLKPVFPLPILFATYDGLHQPTIVGGIVLLIALIAGLVSVAYRTSEEVRYRVDMAYLNLPQFGKIARLARLIPTLFALQMMYLAGQQSWGLRAAYDAARGPVFRRAFARARDAQENGEVRLWAEALDRARDVVPSTMIGLVRIGERRSRVDEKLEMAIDECNRRADELAALLPKKIEVMAAVAFGSMVGLLAYAIIVPISTATAQIH